MSNAVSDGSSQRGALIGSLALVVLGVGLAAGTRSGRVGESTRELTAAVTSDGFAVLEGTAQDRHVIDVDRDGANPRRRAVAVIAPEARMIGTSGGVAMAWRDGGKLVFARVTGDGKLGEQRKFGKAAVQLCDGVASNARRWGVGWLERDGRVWMLHGPTRSKTPDATLRSWGPTPRPELAAKTTWCGIASAGKQIVLMWRDNANRNFMNFCSENGCDGNVWRIPVNQKHHLEGMACTDSACLVALRDDKGAAHLGWMTPKGKPVWSKSLTDATPESRFSLAAAGDHAFAVGYVTREGATVSRVIESGSMVRAWADPFSKNEPALAWAAGRLLVGHRHESGAVAAEVLPLPE